MRILFLFVKTLLTEILLYSFLSKYVEDYISTPTLFVTNQFSCNVCFISVPLFSDPWAPNLY